MFGSVLQFVIKFAFSALAIVLLVAFLHALWRRDVDVGQYGTSKWWVGRWFEVWFPETPNVLKNGDFEQGYLGWGTGWIEALPGNRDFARKHRFLNLNGAVSKWSHQSEGGRRNSGALKVEHHSPRQPHVFSTLSQQIEVKPYKKYEVRFWAKIDSIIPPGGLTVFCGVSDEIAWELGKRSVEEPPHDWKEYSFPFTPDDRVFIDVRLRADGPITAWVDDITVKEVP